MFVRGGIILLLCSIIVLFISVTGRLAAIQSLIRHPNRWIVTILFLFASLSIGTRWIMPSDAVAREVDRKDVLQRVETSHTEWSDENFHIRVASSDVEVTVEEGTTEEIVEHLTDGLLFFETDSSRDWSGRFISNEGIAVSDQLPKLDILWDEEGVTIALDSFSGAFHLYQLPATSSSGLSGVEYAKPTAHYIVPAGIAVTVNGQPYEQYKQSESEVDDDEYLIVP